MTLHASGAPESQAISCKIETGKALAEAGLHPATGGDGSFARSGAMLLEALVACAGVTLNAVATALAGFRDIRLAFDLETDATPEQQATLLKRTERCCVILQTLRNALQVHAELRTTSAAA
jgi:uncharacterized OsmC-like protein